MCKEWFESYDQKIIYLISLTNENENCEDYSDNDDDTQEPHDSDDDVTVDGDFFRNKQNNHVCRNGLYDFLGLCGLPEVEPDDTPEANYQNSFVIGVVEDKESFETFPTDDSADEDFEVRS